MSQPPKSLVLAIDQGTTSSRAIVFDGLLTPVTDGQLEFDQHYPQPGWVEHDPEDIWQSTLSSCKSAVAKLDTEQREQISALGITNQRETTLVWERATGKPIYNAIVWQDRRTAQHCAQLQQSLDAEQRSDWVQQKTGLLLDPYFSASKIGWILDHVDGARARAERGELAFGTVDCYLIWRLTNGQVHATDVTNASRTSLFNIHSMAWDQELLDFFNIPAALLPEVKSCSDDFGQASAEHFGLALPIAGVAGDQQAAAIGQHCFERGSVKSTYGTGCFMLVNTGSECISSQHRLLSTVAYRIGDVTHYALEGSIFVAGAAVQWLRDGLKIISRAAETETLAAALDDNQGVYLVPAFTGLGAPYWDPEARGAIFGLTRATGPAELSRAALESIAYLSNDLLAAVSAEGVELADIKIDGGMVANNWFAQFLTNILAIEVYRPQVLETTAVGAAYLAGLAQQLYPEPATLKQSGQSASGQHFSPAMDSADRQQLLEGWQQAIRRTLSTEQTTP